MWLQISLVVQITTHEPASFTFGAASRVQKETRIHFEKISNFEKRVVALTAQGSNRHVCRGIITKGGRIDQEVQ